MAKDTVSANLSQLDQRTLLSLIEFLRRNYDDINIGIDEFLSTGIKNGDSKRDESSVNRLALSYWNKAYSLIEKMNEYGGADDSDYDDAGNWIEKLKSLLKAGVSAETRREIFDEAFEQYSYSNSGFDDNLMDLMMELCQDREEWKLFASKLQRTGSEYDMEIAMEIMRDHLHDDKAYLKERKAKLRYGLDYFQLVEYYLKNNHKDQAEKTAVTGIIRGEGRLDELFDFLFDQYSREKLDDRIDFLLETSLKRQEYEAEILHKSFQYFYGTGKYEKSVKLVHELLKFRERNFKDLFMELRGKINTEDLENVTGEILDRAKKNDIEDYMEICQILNLDSKMLDVLADDMSRSYRYAFEYRNLNRFAIYLQDKYPEKMLNYFLTKADLYISMGKRKNYVIASRYLYNAEEVECSILHNRESWFKRLEELLDRNSNRPAFIEEYTHFRARQIDV